MVAGEHQLGEVFVPPVLGDFPRVQMAVVVDDWHIRGVFAVKGFGGFGTEQEVFNPIFFHFNHPGGVYQKKAVTAFFYETLRI
jgi:hypothetical protein